MQWEQLAFMSGGKDGDSLENPDIWFRSQQLMRGPSKQPAVLAPDMKLLIAEASISRDIHLEYTCYQLLTPLPAKLPGQELGCSLTPHIKFLPSESPG